MNGLSGISFNRLISIYDLDYKFLVKEVWDENHSEPFAGELFFH